MQKAWRTGSGSAGRPRRSGRGGALLAAAALMVAACGGEGGTGPAEVIPAELAATWVAEPACLPECGFTLASAANPADSINVTAFVGLSTEITMTRDGTFRLRTRPGPDTASVAQVRAGAGVLVVTDGAGAVDTLDYSLAGDYLHLRFRRHFTVFDFTGDGTPDPATARGRFRRR
jgi:hypothetical protein